MPKFIGPKNCGSKIHSTKNLIGRNFGPNFLTPNSFNPPKLIRSKTFVLVRFVHISNISDVTVPILIYLFGPKFLKTYIDMNPNIVGPKFMLRKFGPNFLTTNSFFPQKLIRSKKILDPKIFFKTSFRHHAASIYCSVHSFVRLGTQNFFGQKFFSDPKYFWTKIFWDPNFFGPNIFSDPTFFRAPYFLDPKFVEIQIFLDLTSFMTPFKKTF